RLRRIDQAARHSRHPPRKAPDELLDLPEQSALHRLCPRQLLRLHRSVHRALGLAFRAHRGLWAFEPGLWLLLRPLGARLYGRLFRQSSAAARHGAERDAAALRSCHPDRSRAGDAGLRREDVGRRRRRHGALRHLLLRDQPGAIECRRRGNGADSTYGRNRRLADGRHPDGERSGRWLHRRSVLRWHRHTDGRRHGERRDRRDNLLLADRAAEPAGCHLASSAAPLRKQGAEMSSSFMTAKSDLTAKRRSLRRHRAFATGLLLLAVAIFIAAREWPYPSFVVRLLSSAADAAMVGGLADWFAITALFRRPLGLPIPHTALIPSKKSDIGNRSAVSSEIIFSIRACCSSG